MGQSPQSAAPAADADCFGRGVFVVTGPARSGKTSAVLELYRRRLDELHRPGCLVIVPNFPAAAQVRARLLEAAPTGVLVAPAVTTFSALAASILSHAGKAPRTRTGRRRAIPSRTTSRCPSPPPT